MKKILYTLTAALILLFTSCEQGIDPISVVEPGVDAAVPVVSFVSMNVGTSTKNTLGKDVVSLNVIDSVTIQFKVIDDIEIGDVKVKLNGEQVAEFTSFLDYRRFIKTMGFGKLGLGEYTVTVEVSDTEGNSSQASTMFKKVSPYTRYTENEVMFLPFDSTYQDMVYLGMAEPVGNSYFSAVPKVGTYSLMNPADSYVKIPAANIMNNEISGSFWYLPTTTPRNACILSCSSSPDSQNQGFRLYKKYSNPRSTLIVLSVGTGNGEVLNNTVSVNPKDSVWRHVGFSISSSEATIFIDGVAQKTVSMTGNIDWTGCEELIIGSGGPNFDQPTDESKLDELRFYNKALIESEMAATLKYSGSTAGGGSDYTAKYDGETMFMSFDGGDNSDLVGHKEVVVVGDPGSGAGKIKEAYQGADGASLEIASDAWAGGEFSAAFWMKIDFNQERAGIMSLGNPDDIGADNPRIHGFRIFHEGTVANQRIKMNIGMGDADVWNDGIDVAATEEWIHVAFTIASDKATLYVNGEKGSANNLDLKYAALTAPMDWTGCPKIELFTGGATFAYWNHGSDLGMYDELRFFNKALTDEEVKTIYDDEK